MQPADSGIAEDRTKHQIANFADWCNECGNCDTFCPEYGGPFIQKPSFFTDRAAWLDNPERDGFYVTKPTDSPRLWVGWRARSTPWPLDENHGRAVYNDGVVGGEF